MNIFSPKWKEIPQFTSTKDEYILNIYLFYTT